MGLALKLWGVGNQARFGDNTKPEPSFFAIEAGFKWRAYEKEKGRSKEDCQEEFIYRIEKAMREHGKGYLLFNNNIPGPNYYSGCDGTSSKSLVGYNATAAAMLVKSNSVNLVAGSIAIFTLLAT